MKTQPIAFATVTLKGTVERSDQTDSQLSRPQVAFSVTDYPLPVAVELKSLLDEKQLHIAFAESCTCGLVAALLGQVPGISKWLCGSAVTYQPEVKTQWLGVLETTLQKFSAESIETTLELASGVLEKTPQAEIAIAVTGHLGPAAATEVDGRIFIAMHSRKHDKLETAIQEHQLRSSNRVERQFEAAQRVLQFACQSLKNFK